MISPSERPEYSQVEQDCKGCMGPCGRCHELASERPDALQQAREALHAEINICMAIGRSSPKLTAAIDHLLLVQRQSCDAEILAALELQQAAHRDNLALVRQSWEKE
jgi:hypothetical protein